MANAQEFINLAFRKNLFYPSAEIYGNAPSGFWDFGPTGARIRNNIANFWRKELLEKEGFLEIDGAVTLPEPVFRASGHLENFNDPIVQCKKCSALHRADKLVAESADKIVPESLSTPELDALIKKHKVKCPSCGSKDFAEVKKFNMMMKVMIGATGTQPAYLRPETCQNIFLDFARLNKGSRENLPLGIAQVGKSFRNEISPRNSLLRAREFGQMEIEIFFNPAKISEAEGFDSMKNVKLNIQMDSEKKPKPVKCPEAVKKKIFSGKLIAYYLARLQQFYEKLGIPAKNIRFRELGKDERSFYAKEAFDLEVETEHGWIELVACNNRADFDLKGHARESKKDLGVLDEEGKKFVPHIFELSAGLDRTLYVLLLLNLKKEKRGPEERLYLDLNPQVAPYLAGVFPLVKKDGLKEKAREIFLELKANGFSVLFDEKASIGRRYSRIDEIGVPLAITVDYDTMKDGTVTIRDRNTLAQKRAKATGLPELLWKLGNEKITFKSI